jgi:hypothetical protein
MSATSGKVALVKSATAMTANPTLPDPNVADLVGYGTTANLYEGSSRAPTFGGNSNAIFRKSDGCQDTNNNDADFEALPASPRYSASPVHSCGAQSNPSGSGSANPNPAYAGGLVTLSVTVTPGSNPTSTGITVTANLSALGGDASQAFTEGPTNVFTYQFTIPCNINTGTEELIQLVPVTVQDAQARTASADISVTVRSNQTKLGVTLPPTAPQDDGQPIDTVVCPGDTAQFTVRAEGPGLTYQWYYGPVGSGTLLANGDRDGRVVVSPTSAVLQITNAQAADEGSYYAIVTGVCTGSVTSNAATLTLGTPTTATQKQIVISQIYSGGGNGGSYWTNDFIELYNKGTTPVDVTGWSVQYASSGTTASAAFGTPARYTILSGTIQPGHYFLIQEAQGSGGTHVLDAPDLDGTTQVNGGIIGGIALGANGGKVALVNNSASLAGTCPIGNCTIVDYVGWGDATTCFEGAVGPTTDNTTALFRKSPCVDTDNNAADFAVGAITDPALPTTVTVPHNSSTSGAPEIKTQPADAHICDGQTATFNVVATGACLNYQWQVQVGGNWVNVSTGTGGNTASYTTDTIAAADSGTQYQVIVSNSFGPPATSTPAKVLIDPATADDKQIVINQIYGGGGNAGAVYQNDFVELYNKGTTPVVVDGWSIQYASTSGTSWGNKVNLTGTIQPGHYYLIKGAAGSGCTNLPCGSPIPGTANVTSTLDLSGSNGKLALLKTTTQLGAVACPTADCHVVDFVGYGTANCFEGSNAAPAPSATLSITRTPAGTDTDQNGLDFVAGPPTPTHNAPGDFDGSGNVDQADYDLFVACWTGPMVTGITAGCGDKDLDIDDDIDMVDFGLFQKCFTGNEPANAGCLN